MNTQITKTPKLIQDLGMQYPNENSKRKRRYGLYKCPICNDNFETQIDKVNIRKIKSCGCLKIKHNLSSNKLYDTWKNIIRRCTNQKCKDYKNYGLKGIKVCDRWLDINNFISDMHPSYQEGLSIDRINVNGNYEPFNCRWTNANIQNRNKRLLQSNNTSGYRGVSFKKNRNKFTSQIKVNNKNIYLGIYDDIIEAAKAYNKYIIDNDLEHTKNNI